MSIEIKTGAIANLPWQARAAGSEELIWRYERNPLLKRDLVSFADGVYNSAVVPYQGEYRGVFRLDHKTGMPHLHVGKSKDGLNWEIAKERLVMEGAAPELACSSWEYDPRVVLIDGRYYVMWCNDFHGPTIGLAWTDDFARFHQLENAFLPYNRNGVLFPRKIGGKFVMLSRPSDTGHTPFGDIFLSQSPDLVYWGEHRFVMSKGPEWWQDHKIGPGPAPIETSEGWLLIYHGVCRSCNGLIYRMGLALLDLEKPWQVARRLRYHIFGPKESYEISGMVPNVTFPCAALCDGPSGRLTMYYGSADTCVGLAFASVPELVETLLRNGK